MAIKMKEIHFKVLEYIKDIMDERNYPPSVREIGKALNIKSTSSVHSYLHRLTEFGYISMEDGVCRSMCLLKEDNNIIPMPLRNDLVDIPIVGQVAAGAPIFATENIEDTFTIPASYASDTVSFMLRVKGESMIEAGILDGDLILVKQQNTANDGDMVVAIIEDEATVKTYYLESDHIRLQPENENMDPILIYGDIIIAGKVIGLFRSY